MGVSLVFHGSEKSQTTDYKLQVFANRNDEIFISIDDGSSPDGFICLDIQTAIKFSKELRKAISEAKDVDYG
jgi:hypothetical protein